MHGLTSEHPGPHDHTGSASDPWQASRVAHQGHICAAVRFRPCQTLTLYRPIFHIGRKENPPNKGDASNGRTINRLNYCLIAKVEISKYIRMGCGYWRLVTRSELTINLSAGIVRQCTRLFSLKVQLQFVARILYSKVSN